MSPSYFVLIMGSDAHFDLNYTKRLLVIILLGLNNLNLRVSGSSCDGSCDGSCEGSCDGS